MSCPSLMQPAFFLLACACLSAPHGALGDVDEAAPPSAMGPLRGEYGFLSKFNDITVEEARARVQRMRMLFGVMEFQLPDAFEEYSRPPASEKKEWNTPVGGGVIRRDIIEAYTSEIALVGGRSWLVLNAMATDPGDQALQGDATVAGEFKIGDEPLMDVIVPNAAWADRFVADWADWARTLGFSGILWSTMGDYNSASEKGADFPGFLKAALPIVSQRGLGQSANFVDAFGWDKDIMPTQVLAFALWTVWTIPDREDQFFEEAPAGSVLSLLPGENEDHEGEEWNRYVKGMRPLDVMILRWQKNRCYGNAYLGVGDGTRHATGDYLPKAKQMSTDDIDQVRHKVFGEITCDNDAQPGSGLVDLSLSAGDATLEIPAVPQPAGQQPEDAVVQSAQDEPSVQQVSDGATAAPAAAPAKKAEEPTVTRGTFKIKMIGEPGDYAKYKDVFEDTLRAMYGLDDVTLDTRSARLLMDNAQPDSPQEFVVRVGCNGPCSTLSRPRVSDHDLRDALQGSLALSGAKDTVELAQFSLNLGSEGHGDSSIFSGVKAPQWVMWGAIPILIGLASAGISSVVSSRMRGRDVFPLAEDADAGNSRTPRLEEPAVE